MKVIRLSIPGVLLSAEYRERLGGVAPYIFAKAQIGLPSGEAEVFA